MSGEWSGGGLGHQNMIDILKESLFVSRTFNLRAGGLAILLALPAKAIRVGSEKLRVAESNEPISFKEQTNEAYSLFS